MKKIIIFACLFINGIFANSQLLLGYGVSDYDVPLINYGNVFSHNLFVGVEQRYIINSTDQVVFTGLLTTNRRFNASFLNELEIQTGLKKHFTKHDAITIGFHVSHLLSEHVKEVDLIGTGFGLNIGYTYKYSNQLSFNVQMHSTAYGVTASAQGHDRFTNQTIRTFINFLP